MAISCIVLAGGKGIRLGRNKVTVNIGNRSLLQRVISNLGFLNADIIVVTAKKEPLPQSIDYPRLKVVGDIFPGKGSLGGIYSGLKASDTFHNFVVACDMPFLRRDLIQYMIEVSADNDVIVPRLGDRIEPLHAIYSKNCIPPIEDLFNRNELQIFQFFPFVKMRYVEEEEINKYDLEHFSFFNINTEKDLIKATEMLNGEDTVNA